MAKLIIVVLALAFTALVAFASAHQGNSIYSKQQRCSQQLQGKRFNQCQNYIRSTTTRKQNRTCLAGLCLCGYWPNFYACLPVSEEGQGLGLEECCNELKMVDEECQCEAMQEVYKQAQQQQWSQQSSRQPETQELKQIVKNLSNQCNLQVQQCRIPFAAIF